MEKLLAVAALREKIYGKWFFQRLLAQIFVAIGMVMTTAVLISGVLLSFIYATYYILVSYGAGMMISFGIAMALAFALILTALLVTRHYLVKVNRLPHTLLEQATTLFVAFPAFWQGFTAASKEPL